MVEEALESRLLRCFQDALKVAGGHLISPVRHPRGVHPRQDLVRIAYRRQGSFGLLVNYLVEERLRKSQVQIRQRRHLGQIHSQPGLGHGEAIRFTQTRVPFVDLLHPPRHRAVHAVEPPVPEEVLHQEQVDDLIPGVKIQRGHTRKGSRA
mgnify:CR=1 FL=1